MSLKFRRELCILTMKNDANFEKDLTCQFKIDMRTWLKIVKILSVEHFYGREALYMPATMVGWERKFWVPVALELLFQHFWDLF